MRSRRLSSKGDDDEPSASESVLSDDEPSASASADSDASDASEDSGGHRRSRAFVMPPPREALPDRTTRGKRMGALAVPEDDDADNEFWNQEFFAEEAADDRYDTESEPEDRFEPDFNDSESEEDENEEVEEIEDRNDFETARKKVLKPPGSKKPPAAKKPAGAPTDPSSAPKPAKKPKVVPERTMSVRTSTKVRVEQARAERKFIEETKGKRAYRRAEHKQLTQAELLAEAARTAIENTRSLMYMEAVEEENKRRATSNTGKYVGPMISHHSFKGEDGEEHTVVKVKHMNFPPDYLEPQVLPPLPTREMCAVNSKKVARYKDPVTKLGYADLRAFRTIRQGKAS